MSFGDRRVGISRGRATYELHDVRDRLDDLLASIDCGWKSIVAPGTGSYSSQISSGKGHASKPEEWEQIITNGTIVQAVAEGIAAAMSGVGTLTIADAPQTDSNFEAIRGRLGVDDLVVSLSRRYPKLTVRIVDLRREAWLTRGNVVVERRRLPDAPEGYTCVDLAAKSCFRDKPGPYYGADYDVEFTDAHHSSGHHRYLLARLALDSDVFVNLPKLKTHKKVGVTLSLKNLVGINGDKNFLPHFTRGTPGAGGDEFSRYRNVRFRFVGRWAADPVFGDSAEAIRCECMAAVEHASRPEAFEFLGETDRNGVIDVLRTASIVVLPSRDEGLTLVLLEAMAAGVPVVSSAGIGAIPEVVEDGVTGILVLPGDRRQLIRALEGLIEDSSLRASMGAAGRRRCEERFSKSAWSEGLSRVFISAIGGSEAPKNAAAAIVGQGRT